MQFVACSFDIALNVFRTDPFTLQQSNYGVFPTAFRENDITLLTKGIPISPFFHKLANMDPQESRGAQTFLLFNLTVIHAREGNISKLTRHHGTDSLN